VVSWVSSSPKTCFPADLSSRTPFASQTLPSNPEIWVRGLYSTRRGVGEGPWRGRKSGSAGESKVVGQVSSSSKTCFPADLSSRTPLTSQTLPSDTDFWVRGLYSTRRGVGEGPWTSRKSRIGWRKQSGRPGIIDSKDVLSSRPLFSNPLRFPNPLLRYRDFG
jgi:hypothetical protein